MTSFERPKTLTELVSKALQDMIVSGQLEMGAHLSEARVAKELNVSRTPVREAINRLEMEGLLTVEPQRGTYVFHLEGHELAKLCDARVCLETTALKAAILSNPVELHVALTRCVAQMTDARGKGDDSAYLGLDTDFHQLIFDLSDNRFLVGAYQTLALKMAAVRNRLGRHPDHMAKSYNEHIALAAAVGDGDADTALAILRGHIDRKEGSYWEVATDLKEA